MSDSSAPMSSSRLLLALAHVLFICSTVSCNHIHHASSDVEDHCACFELNDLTGDDSGDNVGWLVSRATWGAQKPIGVMDENITPLERVIVSSTLTDECRSLATCSLQMRYMQMVGIEAEEFYDHPYNFVIGGDGRVYVGRGWDYMAAHTKYNNNRTAGVAFIGTFDFKLPNEAQLKAFTRLVATGVKIGKLSPDYKVQGQCQLRTDNSPGLLLIRAMTSWPHFDKTLNLSCTLQDEIMLEGPPEEFEDYKDYSD